MEKTGIKFVKLQVGLDYFHPQACCYEPVLEKLPFEVKVSTEDRIQDAALDFREPINLNITLSLMGVFRQFQRLWDAADQRSISITTRESEKLGSADDLVIE